MCWYVSIWVRNLYVVCLFGSKSLFSANPHKHINYPLWCLALWLNLHIQQLLIYLFWGHLAPEHLSKSCWPHPHWPEPRMSQPFLPAPAPLISQKGIDYPPGWAEGPNMTFRSWHSCLGGCQCGQSAQLSWFQQVLKFPPQEAWYTRSSYLQLFCCHL